MTNKLFYAIMFCLITIHSNAGGPWAQGKGHGFAQIGFSSTIYKNIFDADGNVQDANGTFQDYTFQSYNEFGISNTITLKLILPYKYVSGKSSVVFDSKQNLQGAGNITLGVSYLFVYKKMKIAARLEMASHAKEKSNPSFYNLRAGYSEFEISPFLSVGASSNKYYWFTDVGAGITRNSVFKFNGEAGYKLFGSLKTAAVIESRIPFTRNGIASEESPEISPSYLYDPFQQYIGIGGKLIYTYREKFGLTVSGFGAFLAKRVADAAAYNIGLFYKW